MDDETRDQILKLSEIVGNLAAHVQDVVLQHQSSLARVRDEYITHIELSKESLRMMQNLFARSSAEFSALAGWALERKDPAELFEEGRKAFATRRSDIYDPLHWNERPEWLDAIMSRPPEQ